MSEHKVIHQTLFFLKQYWKSIIFSAVIVYLSLASSSNFEGLNKLPLFHGFDKFMHYMFYLVLALILLIECKATTDSRIFNPNRIWAAFFYPLLLGGIIELLQGLVCLTRSAEFTDWLFNTVGVITAWILIGIYRQTPLFIQHK